MLNFHHVIWWINQCLQMQILYYLNVQLNWLNQINLSEFHVARKLNIEFRVIICIISDLEISVRTQINISILGESEANFIRLNTNSIYKTEGKLICRYYVKNLNANTLIYQRNRLRNISDFSRTFTLVYYHSRSAF